MSRAALVLALAIIAGGAKQAIHYTDVTPAIVIARKLAAGTLVARGALPCIGLFSLEECLRELEGYDVRTIVERTLI